MSFNAMSTEQPDGTVGNDGWFPSLSVRLFLTLYRLPGEYAADLVSDHLRLGMVWANRQLAAWGEARAESGGVRLA